MALNSWWLSDPAQRYWMEIKREDDRGTDLNAPKLPEEDWHYDLVSQVQPGDRVLHWKAGGGGGLLGWSEATGTPNTVPKYAWKPLGTSGKALSGPRTSEGWVVPLGGIHLFASPPTLQTLLPLLGELMTLRDQLEAKHGTTYFPFYRYRDNEIRAQQSYMVKFPVELFDIIPGIEGARIATEALALDESDIAEDYQPRGRKAPPGRTTRAQDPKLRAAIERHSLDRALAYYEELGGTNPRELGKPYDIAIDVAGVERHCEVKGSTMLIDTVELTINEVNHGQQCGNVDLIVVDGIDIVKDPESGELIGKGGRFRVWPDWSPNDNSLAAKKFAYSLPEQLASTK